MAVAVVTGATGGIGLQVAVGLARAGMAVVLVGRDAGRGAAALAHVRGAVPGAVAWLELADLSLMSAVAALGGRIAAAHPAVAVVVNNAGVFQARRRVTAEGLEEVLAVNHLAPFVLTRALEGALLAGRGRMVLVSSDTIEGAALVPARLAQGGGMKRGYASAKLAATAAAFGWARRWAGGGAVAHAVHPGLVRSGLVRSGGVIGLAWRVMGLWARTEAEGAAEVLRVALAPEWGGRSGCYVKDGRAVAGNALLADAGFVDAVWGETERLVGGQASRA